MSSMGSLPSLSSSRRTCCGFVILTESRIAFMSFRLLSWTVVPLICRSSSVLLMTERHSASAKRESSPMMSMSHWVNCLVLPCLMGSSRKTGPIWNRLKGSLRLGFCLKILASWKVNSYLRERFLPARSSSLNLSLTASSSPSEGSVSDLTSSSYSMIGVSRGWKPAFWAFFWNTFFIFSRSCDCGGSESWNPFTVSMLIFIFVFLFVRKESARGSKFLGDHSCPVGHWGNRPLYESSMPSAYAFLRMHKESGRRESNSLFTEFTSSLVIHKREIVSQSRSPQPCVLPMNYNRHAVGLMHPSLCSFREFKRIVEVRTRKVRFSARNEQTSGFVYS